MLPQRATASPAQRTVTKKEDAMKDVERLLTEFETNKRWGDIGISIRNGYVCVISFTVTERKNDIFQKEKSYDRTEYR
jgi:hypothetical protein